MLTVKYNMYIRSHKQVREKHISNETVWDSHVSAHKAKQTMFKINIRKGSESLCDYNSVMFEE